MDKMRLSFEVDTDIAKYVIALVSAFCYTHDDGNEITDCLWAEELPSAIGQLRDQLLVGGDFDDKNVRIDSDERYIIKQFLEIKVRLPE